MPRAEILSTQAMHTLRQLHAELGGKIIDNKLDGDRLRLQMQQVEAVMKMLDPGIDLRPIAVRRKKANPWFKKGQGYRGAIDVLRTAAEPMTATDIAKVMLDRKGITDPDKAQFADFASGIATSLRNHNGKTVEGIGHHPVRWKLL